MREDRKGRLITSFKSKFGSLGSYLTFELARITIHMVHLSESVLFSKFYDTFVAAIFAKLNLEKL